MRPLEGVKVLDFSQYLAGPSATLRLADLGAEVVKVEREGVGDGCRNLRVPDCEIEGESPLFCAVNRNKDSICLNLKAEESKKSLEKLIRESDVGVFSFRPGVAERLGLSYEDIRKWNPRLIYVEVSGYGSEGPWAKKPGQDLLAQSLSGLPWLNGNAGDAPTPMGLSIADMFAGQYLVQGIISALIRRENTGEGGYIQVNLLESITDVQFEVLTTYLNDGHCRPQRCSVNNANAYISAPYGVYETKEGYLAIAMCSIVVLGQLLGCDELLKYTDESEWATKRDAIKEILKEHLMKNTAEHWLGILEAADIWCSRVLNWDELFQEEGFQVLGMLQDIRRDRNTVFQTTRCPITIDGERYYSDKPVPMLGQNNEQYL